MDVLTVAFSHCFNDFSFFSGCLNFLKTHLILRMPSCNKHLSLHDGVQKLGPQAQNKLRSYHADAEQGEDDEPWDVRAAVLLQRLPLAFTLPRHEAHDPVTCLCCWQRPAAASPQHKQATELSTTKRCYSCCQDVTLAPTLSINASEEAITI